MVGFLPIKKIKRLKNCEINILCMLEGQIFFQNRLYLEAMKETLRRCYFWGVIFLYNALNVSFNHFIVLTEL